MKFLKKLLSKKGQLSMEVGILVAAAVLVAIVAGYYYVKNAKKAAETSGQQAESFVSTTNKSANEYLGKLESELGVGGGGTGGSTNASTTNVSKP
jgi:uncharacterized protein (UPF0333 family)